VTDEPDMGPSIQPVDKTEAVAALAAADQSRQRSFSLYFYRFNAPVLMLWGALWMAADLTIAYAPWSVANWAWPAASLVGSIVCVIYYWRASGAGIRPQSRIRYFRMAATWAFTATFVVCAMYIFAPFKWREPHAFFGVLIGTLYAINGIWTGWRLTALGGAMAGLVMYAFFGLSDRDFLPFIGVVCGGGMILGGLWLRTA
jgi:hypothetical protein